MRKHRRLWDSYRFPGFRPGPTVVGVFGDRKARVIRLRRRGKKRCAELVAAFVEAGTNKIRVIQRRSYGLRDEDYLRLKVLTCMLAPI